MKQIRSQNGVALVLVLILLGTGGLIIGPALRQTSTALNFFGISRENVEVAYALDAVTQQALWLLESSDPFEECDSGEVGDETFAECVAAKGSWELTTTDNYDPLADNETLVAAVNGQQVIVTVQVPGALGAPPDPTPTPTPGNVDCFYAWVTRDPTWVQVGDPITYTLHVWNCSSSPSNKNLRNVAVITSGQMTYELGSTGGSLVSPPIEPNPPAGGDCTALATDTTIAICPGYPADSLVLSWPDEDDTFGRAGNPAVALPGGDPPPAAKTLTFQLTPQSWGIFYIDVLLCYKVPTNACTVGEHQNTDKVAPVVAGMFNIQGKGKGNAFGASSKLDGSGADLISEQPQ